MYIVFVVECVEYFLSAENIRVLEEWTCSVTFIRKVYIGCRYVYWSYF